VALKERGKKKGNLQEVPLYFQKRAKIGGEKLPVKKKNEETTNDLSQQKNKRDGGLGSYSFVLWCKKKRNSGEIALD